MLARHLDRISEHHRWSRDFTLLSLQAALREVIACFPVYRTYIRAAKGLVRVGSDPERFGVSVATFHQRNAERLAHWAYSLLATSF